MHGFEQQVDFLFWKSSPMVRHFQKETKRKINKYFGIFSFFTLGSLQVLANL